MILDGKVVAQKVLDEVRAGVARFRGTAGAAPTLAVVLVGDFAPSKIYVANKKKAAEPVSQSAVLLPVLHQEHEGSCGPNCSCSKNEEGGCCGG